LVIKNDGNSDLAPPDKNEQARVANEMLDVSQYLESMKSQFTAAISLLAQHITELEARVTLLTEKVNDRNQIG
jgi:phage-related minor tail protein